MLKTKELCVGLNSVRMTLGKAAIKHNAQCTMHSNAKSLAVLTQCDGFCPFKETPF